MHDWNDRLVKGDERDAVRIFKASCNVGDYGLWQVPDKADWKSAGAAMMSCPRTWCTASRID
ncbi:hypothetical protein IFR35_04290 [Pseudomonas fluorescens]|uniref:hypothetical protein n=1 Tax=Pseudomonas TaxID=286 RepID=UPI0015AE1846|nr:MULTISPECIES: hypothetical protein [Pseudomonas]MBD8190492.1 hypothetical protein [Pseudomonas fluorescens]MBD8225118.1 hypothetical protein [Pseudomonas fluorescens]MBD8783424.1 hypothetical protein [Pseudomonas fluorescens]MBD8815663.1 hypothetical protein [Pseudomonas fluorescens]